MLRRVSSERVISVYICLHSAGNDRDEITMEEEEEE